MSDSDTNKSAMSAHRKPKAATTHNRKRVARPVRDQMVLTKKEDVMIKRPAEQPAVVKRTMMRMQQRSAQTKAVAPARPTAAEVKNEAIRQAMASAAKADANKKQHKTPSVHFGFKRVALALACAAVAVFAIVYFVNLNAPSVSLKVAAMQTGIEASYPSYVPRDFSLSDITSENGRIVLNFKNAATGDAFSLTEENSTWDSNALLNNYVKDTFGENYVVVKEQGLTIYISGSDATWVNGGLIYKLKTNSGSLTKKQIKTIAVSL